MKLFTSGTEAFKYLQEIGHDCDLAVRRISGKGEKKYCVHEFADNEYLFLTDKQILKYANKIVVWG